jgi:hypothetical protein
MTAANLLYLETEKKRRQNQKTNIANSLFNESWLSVRGSYATLHQQAIHFLA